MFSYIARNVYRIFAFIITKYDDGDFARPDPQIIFFIIVYSEKLTFHEIDFVELVSSCHLSSVFSFLFILWASFGPSYRQFMRCGYVSVVLLHLGHGLLPSPLLCGFLNIAL